jgi:hypothetical protein
VPRSTSRSPATVRGVADELAKSRNRALPACRTGTRLRHRFHVPLPCAPHLREVFESISDVDLTFAEGLGERWGLWDYDPSVDRYNVVVDLDDGEQVQAHTAFHELAEVVNDACARRNAGFGAVPDGQVEGWAERVAANILFPYRLVSGAAEKYAYNPAAIGDTYRITRTLAMTQVASYARCAFPLVYGRIRLHQSTDNAVLQATTYDLFSAGTVGFTVLEHHQLNRGTANLDFSGEHAHIFRGLVPTRNHVWRLPDAVAMPVLAGEHTMIDATSIWPYANVGRWEVAFYSFVSSEATGAYYLAAPKVSRLAERFVLRGRGPAEAADREQPAENIWRKAVAAPGLGDAEEDPFES